MHGIIVSLSPVCPVFPKFINIFKNTYILMPPHCGAGPRLATGLPSGSIPSTVCQSSLTFWSPSLSSICILLAPLLVPLPCTSSAFLCPPHPAEMQAHSCPLSQPVPPASPARSSSGHHHLDTQPDTHLLCSLCPQNESPVLSSDPVGSLCRPLEAAAA